MKREARDYAPCDVVRRIEAVVGPMELTTEGERFVATGKELGFRLWWSKSSSRFFVVVNHGWLVRSRLLELAKRAHKSGAPWGILGEEAGTSQVLAFMPRHVDELVSLVGLGVLTAMDDAPRTDVETLIPQAFLDEAAIHAPGGHAVAIVGAHPGVLARGPCAIMTYGPSKPSIIFTEDGPFVTLPEVCAESELAGVIRALPHVRKFYSERPGLLMSGNSGLLVAKWTYNVKTLLVLVSGMMVYGEDHPGQWEEESLPSPTHHSNTLH